MIAFTTKDAKVTKVSEIEPLNFVLLCDLRTTYKFYDMRNVSDSDIPLAKHVLSSIEGPQRRYVQKGMVFLNLCALAPLREIFLNSVAALPR